MKEEKDLLKPRYKVIADYPNSPFTIEGICACDIVDDRPHVKEEQYMIYNGVSYFESFFNKYPHLFKRLEWWEERKLGEMPEYIKLNMDNGYVHKVEKWEGFNSYDQPLYKYLNRVGYLSTACAQAMIPATLEEYTTYISTQKLKA